MVVAFHGCDESVVRGMQLLDNAVGLALYIFSHEKRHVKPRCTTPHGQRGASPYEADDQADASYVLEGVFRQRRARGHPHQKRQAAKAVRRSWLRATFFARQPVSTKGF